MGIFLLSSTLEGMKLSGTAVVLLFVVLFYSVEGITRVLRHTQEGDRSNQYLVHDDDDTWILVDTGNGQDSTSLLNFISAYGAPYLNMVFLTSGSVESFGGVAALYEFYPNAEYTVPSYDVYDELLENVHLAPASTFNYQQNIRVLSNDNLLDEVDVTVFDGFPPAETKAYAVLVNRPQNWVITGEALYIDCHPYLGVDLDGARLYNWYTTTLPAMLIGGSLGFDRNTVFYPGHGKVGDQEEVARTIDYLKYFETTLNTCVTGLVPIALDDVSAAMVAAYPLFECKDNLNAMEDNPNWVALQQQNLVCANYEYGSSASVLSCSLVIVLIAFFMNL